MCKEDLLAEPEIGKAQNRVVEIDPPFGYIQSG